MDDKNKQPEPVALPFAVLDALRFYANGLHFNMNDRDAWDTVSGEPQNFWCDEAGTATVEDGSIAKAVLQGVAFTDGEDAAPIENEVYTSEFPAAICVSEDLRVNVYGVAVKIRELASDMPDEWCRNEFQGFAAQLVNLCQIPAAPAPTQGTQEPVGWKLVPVHPTPEMWDAVNKLDDEMAAGSYDGKGCSIEQAWECLLAAAPSTSASPAALTDEQILTAWREFGSLRPYMLSDEIVAFARAVAVASPGQVQIRADGFRDCIDAIKGAIALGQQNANPAPEGHWLAEFWEMGRKLAASPAALTDAQIEQIWDESQVNCWPDERNVIGFARALLAAAPATSAAPTPQQISDYLNGLDSIKRAVVEREARAASPAALTLTGDEVRAITKAARQPGSDHPSGLDYVMATVAYLNRRAASPADQVEDARDAALRSVRANVSYIIGCLPHDETHRSSLDQAKRAIAAIDAAMSASKEPPKA